MSNYNVERMFGEFRPVPGWYELPQVSMSEFFLTYNRYPELEMVGNLAEIGVFEGRSALHLAMHLHAGETLDLFDPYEKTAEVAAMVQGLTQGVVRGHRMLSQSLGERHIPSRSVRYMRIDGNHTRRAIRHDLDVANRVLAEHGVINLDDFFNPSFVGVTYGALEWLTENRGAFELLLVGFSQAYLCRPSYIPHYMYYMRQMPDFLRSCGFSDFTFTRASGPSDCLAVGINARQHDRDWLMSETDYADLANDKGRLLEY